MSLADEDAAAQRERLRIWTGDDPARRDAAERALRIWAASSGLKRSDKPGSGGGFGILLLFCLVLGALLFPTIRMELTADVNSRRSILRDVPVAVGVRADLDAGTALDLSEEGGGIAIRMLDGAAIFDVDPTLERRVEVISGDVRVRVTGTEFAVENSGDRVAVSVIEGAVEVELETASSASLSAGSLWLRETPGLPGTVSDIPDTSSVAAWRDGWLDADELSLRDMAAILDRRFAGQVIFGDGDLADRRVTGRYRLDDPMDALASAAAAHGGRVVFATPWIALVVPE
ncbi:MAG: FecR domain-containing protein [Pseudomonadota bacterium]